MPFHHVENAGEPGHRIFYRVLGNPEAPIKMLFTMGLGGDHYHWETQAGYFEKQDGFAVCVYDNRGIGFSDPVPGRWTTKQMAKDAVSLLRHLGWKERVHLVGLSMGGMITQEIALLEPERFASITLISTIAGGLPSLWYFVKSLPTGIRKVLESFLVRDPRARLHSALSVLFPDEFLALETYNEEKQAHEPNSLKFRRMLIQRGRRAKEDGIPPLETKSIMKQVLAVATHRVPHDSLERLGKRFKDSSLVITGNQDILVHHKNSHNLQKGLDAKLVVLESAGHGANEQYADHVNELIHQNVLAGERNFKTQSKL